MTVTEALAGVERLGLDTAPLIYFVEQNPDFYPVCRDVFAAVAAGDVVAYTAALSLAETLVKPMTDGDAALVNAYEGLLTRSRGVHLVLAGRAVARTAAGLRARYGRALRLPDAMQIASALHAGCRAFLTNDDGLKRVTEIPMLIVSELVPNPPLPPPATGMTGTIGGSAP